jgi:hypothetical protein
LAILLAAAQALATSPAPKKGDLPPGSSDDDPSPSDVIFPTQDITIRFDHKLHVQGQHLRCQSCHAAAMTSDSVGDSLIPPGTQCDACHQTDHADLHAVKGSACATCHEGYQPSDGNVVRGLDMPRANMIFSHKRHAQRNINCQQCHGRVEDVGLATRDQLPRMRGCLHCHQAPDVLSRGDAKGACDTCHLRGGPREGGTIRTTFAQGKLLPPAWLHDAEHGPDFLERHKSVAGADSAFCASCHKEDFCVDCHDGRVRPRNIHPNDYLSMHPVDARMNSERCTSCHRQQSFCLDCHLRAGVGESSPSGVKSSVTRFHPPAAIWSGPVRGPGHHAFEAQRNLNACVSCHVERDCVACHGGSGIGAGANIHPAGFLSSCGMQMRRNPRPCLVCHQPFEIAGKCR